MNLDRITIPIEPRSAGGCLDLAIGFYRRYLWQQLGLTALVALPALALTWYACEAGDSGLWWGLLIFFFSAPLAGSLLVAGAGHKVFGERYTVRRALGAWWPQGLRLCWSMFWARILVALSVVGVVLPFLVGARSGFLPEVTILERLRGRRRRQRLGELARAGVTSPASRYAMLLLFGLLASVLLYIGLDALLSLIFKIDLLTTGGYGFGAALDRLAYHPVVVTTLMAVFWVLYPLVRLAWFFCYLDQRIRNECWDVELDFRREAGRLGA